MRVSGPAPFRSHVDGLYAGQLTGWAYQANDPARPCRIGISIDGRHVGVFIADQYRADLEQAGFPNPSCSFAIDYGPLPISAGAQVRFCDVDTQEELVGSPLTFPALPSARGRVELQPSTDLGPSSKHPASGLVGAIHIADRRRVTGWVLDRSKPNPLAVVEVLGPDDAILAEVVAMVPRPDLLEPGAADELKCFDVSLPLDRTLGFSLIRIRDKASGTVLAEATLSRFVAGLDVATQKASQSHLTGWVINGERYQLRPKLVAKFGDREVSLGAATLFRGDLHKIGAGDGFCGFALDKGLSRGAAITTIIESRTGETLFQAELRADPSPEPLA